MNALPGRELAAHTRLQTNHPCGYFLVLYRFSRTDSPSSHHRWHTAVAPQKGLQPLSLSVASLPTYFSHHRFGYLAPPLFQISR